MRPGSARGVVALSVLTVGVFLVSLAVGRFPIPLLEVAHVLLSRLTGHPSGAGATVATVLLLVRLPRVWAAMLIGAGLSLAGASYQTVFRNPIVSPSLLGVSSGAGFGAAVALLLHGPAISVQAAAFAGGLIAVTVSILVHRLLGGRSLVTLVLCGLVVAAFFESLVALVKTFADPLEVLPDITFWFLGSLEKVTAADARWATLPILLCAAGIYVLRWRSTALALGDEEALSLGIAVGRERLIVIALATLMVAVAVSLAGVIGWVGLIVPHLARMLFGLSPGRLYPATAMLGATFLLLVDDVARSASATELPLGVLTAMIGAPLFLLLLARIRSSVWT